MAFNPQGKKSAGISNFEYPVDYSGDYEADNLSNQQRQPVAQEPVAENPAPTQPAPYVRNRRFGNGTAPQPTQNNQNNSNNSVPQAPKAFGARSNSRWGNTNSNTNSGNLNNANSNGANQSRPTPQPSQYDNQGVNRTNQNNGTQRFNQASNPALTKQAQDRNSSALSNFIPAGAAYSRSEPSKAYLEKVNSGNVNMRFSYWGNARTQKPFSYPLEIEAPKPVQAPVRTPAPASNTNTESYIPARKRSGFETPLEMNSAAPAPAASEQKTGAFRPQANTGIKKDAFTTNRNATPESASSYAPENTYLSEDEQLKKAFISDNQKSTSEQNNDNQEANKRFAVINSFDVNITSISLKDTFDNLIQKIDADQVKIDAELERLRAAQAAAEPEKKAKKPTKKELAAQAKLEEEQARTGEPTSVDNSATKVEETSEVSDVTPKKRQPNANFKPKTIVNGSQFQTQENHNYEGVSVSDLEKSGISTSELLNLSNIHVSEKARFDVQQLSTVPVEILLEVLGGEKHESGIKVGQHIIQQQENTLKWFNLTTNKGSTGSINLMKHLIAVESNVLEHDNDKILFKAACQKLTTLMPELLATYDKNNAENIAKQEADRKDQYYKLINAIDALPLIDIMNFFQGKNNHKGISGRWKVNTNGHVYSINSSGWYSFTESVGGRGAIGFASHVIALENNLNYNDKNDQKKLRRLAIGMLKEEFKNDIDLDANYDDVAFYSGDFKVPFSMPLILPSKQNQVRNYLHEKRGLPNWIINKQMAAGLLFPGFPSDWKNPPTATTMDTMPDKNIWAVFLAKNGGAAEMRGIARSDGSAKIIAKGSEKESGGHLVKAEAEYTEGMLCSFEASIDACSYAAIYPGRVTSSCMGVNYNLAASMAIETLENGYKYGLCFDNDLVGNVNHYRFKEELIARIGQEEYDEYYNAGKIEYFQLGRLTLKEQVYSGQRYYFDVNYDMDGKNTFRLFHEELVKDIGLEETKRLYSTGLVFAYNVTPDFALLRNKDIEAEAVKVAETLLNEKKPLYFVTEPPKLDSSEADIQEKIDEHKEKLEKHTLFMAHFKQALGAKYNELQRSGAIIKNTNSFAKDWNEYLNKMRDLHPEFAKQQQEYEDKFSTIYTKDIQLELVAGKIKKRP